MPSLYDMFNLYIIDQLFSKESVFHSETPPVLTRKVPIICIHDKYHVGAKRVLLPTIPVWHGMSVCFAYYVFSDPMMSFAPGILNAREFRSENLCEGSDSIFILMHIKELLPFSNNVNLVVSKAIDPWMHEERERQFTQLYGGKGN